MDMHWRPTFILVGGVGFVVFSVAKVAMVEVGGRLVNGGCIWLTLAGMIP